MTSTRAIVALLFLLPAAQAPSQSNIDPSEVSARTSPYLPPPQYRIRTEARLVEVWAVVRDRRDRVVGGLTKSDFEIRDSGVKREVTAFSVHSFTPAAGSAGSGRVPESAERPGPTVRARFVGLVVDDLNSNLAELRNSQLAATRFVRENLAAGDQVAIFTTSHAQILPFTSDVPALVAAIESLKPNQPLVDGGTCPRLTPYDAYLIAEKHDDQSLEVKINEAVRCDPGLKQTAQQLGGGASSNPPPISLLRLPRNSPAVLRITQQASFIWLHARTTSQATLGTIRNIVDYMSTQPGSRLLLLASGGFLSGSLEGAQGEIISRALRGQVMINSIDAKGLFTEDAMDVTPGADATSVRRLQSLGTQPKEQTNDALVYLASSTGGLFFHNNNDLDQGFRELAKLPEVTYLLGFTPDAVPDEKYHQLEVRLTNSSGRSVQARPGYYAVADDPGPTEPPRRLDQEVHAATILSAVPASLAPLPGGSNGDGTGLAAVLHVDLKQLPLLDKSGIRTQQLKFIAALLDGQGNFVVGREGVVDLALRESTFSRLLDAGINVRLHIAAPPGTYRLRFVIEAADQGSLTASTQAVSVEPKP